MNICIYCYENGDRIGDLVTLWSLLFVIDISFVCIFCWLCVCVFFHVMIQRVQRSHYPLLDLMQQIQFQVPSFNLVAINIDLHSGYLNKNRNGGRKEERGRKR